MNYKTIDDFQFKGKRVLLRADLNSEVDKGKVVMGPRISESAKTIKELMGKGARVVILAHQGRKGDEDYTDLSQHAKLLGKLIKVKFVEDVIGGKAQEAIKGLKDGEALLLDNVRSLDEELKYAPGNIIVKTLSPLFDIYLNDAFSVSHRTQTSIVGFPPVLDNGIGRLMQYELESIEKLQVKDALYILGGAKEENMKLIKPGRKILTCGVFGHLCIIAGGKDLGAQNVYLKDKIAEIVPKLKPLIKNVNVPVDLAVRDDRKKRKDLKIDEFPSMYEVYDIGPETKKRYVEEIMKAKVILMKGTAGFCEEEQFCVGTEAILKAIIKSKAFSVLGGGHTTSALEKLGISQKKFGYVSLSGGAFVSYLAGEKLPGLEILKKKK